MIAAYLSVIEAAGNMPQTRDRPSSSSDNQRKLAAMQNTTDDHAAMSESFNFATSTLSIEHSVIWNGGSAITIWFLNVRMWELNWLIRTRNNAIDREGTCDSSMMLLVVSNPRLWMLWQSGRLTKIFAHGWIGIIRIMLEALRLGYNPRVKANSCAVVTNAALISSRRRPAFSLILYSSWRLLLIVGYEWRGDERARNGLIVWYLISILNYIS